MSLLHPHRRRLGAGVWAAALAAACGGVVEAPVTPAAPPAPRPDVGIAALPPVRISEIHYNNVGVDVGEAVEVSFPVGTDLSGWSVVRYNGTNPASGIVYATPGANESLGALAPTVCTGGTRAVVVVTYPQDGLQNGPNDGIALVNGSTVVEFLSYQGVVVAGNGVAAGMTSTDIGVSQSNATPLGTSLQRTAAGDNTWTGPTTASFGACNDEGSGPTVGPLETVTIAGATSVVVGGDVTLTALAEDAEQDDITAGVIQWSDGGSPSVTITPSADGRSAVVHGDAAGGPVTITATLTLDGRTRSDDHPVTVTTPGPTADVRISELHYDDDGTDTGERVEVEGPAGTSLDGWTVVLYNGNGGARYATLSLSGTLAASCDGRGVAVVDGPAGGIQNGAPDGLALVNAGGQVVEFLSYEGTFQASDGPAAGMTSTDIGVDEDPVPPDGRSLQRARNGVWFGPALETFGTCNAAEPPPPTPTGLTLVGRAASDPPLPIGYQDQLFAQDGGTSVPAGQLTWSVDTPAIASVDQEGVVTGLAAGTAVVRATRTSDGATGTFSIPVENPPDGPAVYANHLEFGAPVDATPGDEIRVTWPEFVSSYSATRGQPNWVAYNLEATHRGPADRCECFTHDPSLPGGVPVLTTDDYTNSNYSRGHMVMSEDRTSGPSGTLTSIDNARTFLFSNIVPQTAENNGGPWLSLETYLGGLAESGTKEIYVYAGGAAYSGTLKNEGKVAIPTRTWKVAVIVDRNEGLADVRSLSDLEVIAIDVPNTTTVSGDWTAFRVSVDQVEALTGYDLLSALPDDIEAVVEAQQPGVRNLDINVQPAQISVSTTAVVNVVLYSTPSFDARTVNAADVRLVVNGGTAVAPIVRGTTVNTSVADANGDGRPDRLIGFNTSALRAAGFAPGASSLVLRPLGTPPAWEGRDLTPPTVVP